MRQGHWGKSTTKEKDRSILMFYIGNHVSSSNGFEAMGRKTTELGGNTFAFFTRNPRGSKAKKEDPADCAAAVAA